MIYIYTYREGGRLFFWLPLGGTPLKACHLISGIMRSPRASLMARAQALPIAYDSRYD